MNFAEVRRGAIVVAHPDDETLFCAGLMLRYPGRWSVICCSIPRVDPIRAWKFLAACDSLGVKGRFLPFVESEPMQALGNLGALDLSGFDCIVTHNAEGEYGHVHHRCVHDFVVSYAEGAIVTIGFRNAGEGAIRLELNADERSRKLKALKCYDHASPSDGKPKWQALIERYSPMFDLNVETYDVHRA